MGHEDKKHPKKEPISLCLSSLKSKLGKRRASAYKQTLLVHYTIACKRIKRTWWKHKLTENFGRAYSGEEISKLWDESGARTISIAMETSLEDSLEQPTLN